MAEHEGHAHLDADHQKIAGEVYQADALKAEDQDGESDLEALLERTRARVVAEYYNTADGDEFDIDVSTTEESSHARTTESEKQTRKRPRGTLAYSPAGGRPRRA